MSVVREGLVVCARSGFFEVELEGTPVVCRMRGRLKQGRKTTDLAVIGDVVRVVLDGADATIEEVLPRRSVFSRLAPQAKRPVEDVLAANLDELWVCVAVSAPPFRPRLVDRFLVIAEWNRIRPVVLLTKTDEAEDPLVPTWRAAWTAAGYDVIAVSVPTGSGLDALAERLEGHTVALVGPSGAGKSTLLGALDASLSPEIAALGAAQKGAHTTRVARLFPIRGGRVADTPGIRELAPFELPRPALGSVFPDLCRLAEGCQFRDRQHDREPGCAVAPAARSGALSPERYDSYLRQLRGEST